MPKYRFSSQPPTDVSNKGTVDPNSIKKPIIINTQNQKSEPFITKTERTVEHVDAPVLAIDYKLTVQTKVEPSIPCHAQTRFSLGQQRRTSPHISEPMEKLVLASDKEDSPSNPIHKLNPPTKIEQVNDFEVVNNTRDKPKSSFPDNSSSSQAKVEPIKDYKVINGKWDKPLNTIPEQKYNSPKKVGTPTNYGMIIDKKDSPPSPIHNQTYASPKKSHEVIDEKHDKPSTLVRDSRYKAPATKVEETKKYGSPDNKWGKTTSQAQEPPKKVEEYFTKVQNEASRPTRYEGVVEPYAVGKNEWKGPSKRDWGIVPTQVTPIYGPTNDIREAVGILKEAVKSAATPQYNLNYPDSRISQSNTYMGHIDSSEAQRRYGNPNLSAGPFPHYKGSISSTEAARKYGGAPV